MNEKFFMLTDLLWKSVDIANQQNYIALNLSIKEEVRI